MNILATWLTMLKLSEYLFKINRIKQAYIIVISIHIERCLVLTNLNACNLHLSLEGADPGLNSSKQHPVGSKAGQYSQTEAVAHLVWCRLRFALVSTLPNPRLYPSTHLDSFLYRHISGEKILALHYLPRGNVCSHRSPHLGSQEV